MTSVTNGSLFSLLSVGGTKSLIKSVLKQVLCFGICSEGTECIIEDLSSFSEALMIVTLLQNRRLLLKM